MYEVAIHTDTWNPINVSARRKRTDLRVYKLVPVRVINSGQRSCQVLTGFDSVSIGSLQLLNNAVAGAWWWFIQPVNFCYYCYLKQEFTFVTKISPFYDFVSRFTAWKFYNIKFLALSWVCMTYKIIAYVMFH